MRLYELNMSGGNIAPVIKSPEFKKWFSGSKVVDENGLPEIMYHSTMANFDSFYSFSHFGTLRAAHDRISLKNTEGFIPDHPSWNIIPVFLSIKKPIDIHDEGKMNDIDDYIQATIEIGLLTDNEIEFIETSSNKEKDLISILKRKGYDGFRYVNDVEDKGSISWVVFEPNQVKSIFNNGKFTNNGYMSETF